MQRTQRRRRSRNERIALGRQLLQRSVVGAKAGSQKFVVPISSFQQQVADISVIEGSLISFPFKHTKYSDRDVLARNTVITNKLPPILLADIAVHRR